MLPLKKILVPVDFSPCSRRALERALSLAKGEDATVYILHVWQPPYYVLPNVTVVGQEGQPSTLEQLAHIEVMKQMEDLVTLVEARGLHVRRLHEVGEPWSTIVKVAATGHHDLIVMGTHGRTGVAHDALGSVAERVIARAPCPVLTIRDVTAQAAAA